MQRMQTEIQQVHLPTLARDIRKHYLSLSETERASFIQANP